MPELRGERTQRQSSQPWSRHIYIPYSSSPAPQNDNTRQWLLVLKPGPRLAPAAAKLASEARHCWHMNQRQCGDWVAGLEGASGQHTFIGGCALIGGMEMSDRRILQGRSCGASGSDLPCQEIEVVVCWLGVTGDGIDWDVGRNVAARVWVSSVKLSFDNSWLAALACACLRAPSRCISEYNCLCFVKTVHVKVRGEGHHRGRD